MTNENLDLFEKHHHGKLSEKERLTFEKELELDTSLANEYHDFVQIRNSLTNADNQRLRSKIGEIIKQERQVRKNRIIPKSYLVAASLLAIACFSFYFYTVYPSTNEKLYSEFHTPYTETISVLGSKNNPFEKCLELYNQSDYFKAKNCFEQLPKNTEALFFSAMCMLETDEYKSAIKELKKVENMSNAYLEESNWYLALLYLRKGEHKEVKERLNIILNNPKSSYKKESAKRLISLL